MNLDRLKKLAAEKRSIPGIYNYCDRWCERCPQTSHCLNFSISEEEFSNPEMRDIRNEAFWNKLSEILKETMEVLRESAKEWGIELETSDAMADIEELRMKDAAAKNHLLYRAAKRYSELVEDWFRGRENLFFETVAAAREGVSLDEAIEVIQWYQYFICAKVMRAVRGRVERGKKRDAMDSQVIRMVRPRLHSSPLTVRSPPGQWCNTISPMVIRQ